MVKDVGTGERFHLEHLIKVHFEKVAADKKTAGCQRRVPGHHNESNYKHRHCLCSCISEFIKIF
jgi:hypothetical protein